MRIAFATDNDFWLEDQGTRRRIADLIRYLLGREHSVAVFYTRRLKPEDERLIAERLPGLRVASFPPPPALVSRGAAAPAKPSLWQSALSFARNRSVAQAAPASGTRIVRHADKKLSDFRSEFHVTKFRSFCEDFDPDAVVVEFIRLAYLVEGFHDWHRPPPTFIDTIDVMHLRSQRFHAHNEPHWVDLTMEEEAAALRPFDCIVAIQDRDAETFRTMVPDSRIVVAGYPIAVREHPHTLRSVVRVAYVAAAGVPNRKALEAFFVDVWPGIRRIHGAAVELHVAGAVCDSVAAESIPEGVVLRGFVEDLDRFYADTDIVVNPVSFGGGLKIKCVEALGHGLPLVTTPVGAEGIESGAGTAYVLAEDTAGFIDALHALVQSPESRHELSRGALAFAREQFCDDAAYGDLLQAIRELHGERRARKDGDG